MRMLWIREARAQLCSDEKLSYLITILSKLSHATVATLAGGLTALHNSSHNTLCSSKVLKLLYTIVYFRVVANV